MSAASAWVAVTSTIRNRPAADSFAIRFRNTAAARLYRTGDLARWRSDGILECLGRIDHQVKIRGCRIELEEIEHVLMEHPGVQSAVAVARDNVGGETQLIAYIVAATDERPKANELRDFLKTRLPAHMIPAGYFFLDHMPLTAHGKLDRSALAAFGSGARSDWRGHFVAPRNSTEEVLAGIWADLLEVEEIGIFEQLLRFGRPFASRWTGFWRGSQMSSTCRCLSGRSSKQVRSRRWPGGSMRQPRRSRQSHGTRDCALGRQMAPELISIAQEHVLRIERELPGCRSSICPSPIGCRDR